MSFLGGKLAIPHDFFPLLYWVDLAGGAFRRSYQINSPTEIMTLNSLCFYILVAVGKWGLGLG